MAKDKITARQLAASILNKAEKKKIFASELLKKELTKTEEKNRTTDLVTGCIRNRTAIDIVITKSSGRKIKNISPNLVNIIRIAAYELLYNPKTAEHAVINEAVELAKKRTNKKAAGFVNAVLRNIQRNIDIRDFQTDRLAASVLPTVDKRAVKFKNDIYPHPEKNLKNYLSQGFSLPDWLIKIWLKNFKRTQVIDICRASNRKPDIYIRPNSLKTSPEKLVTLLKEQSIDCLMIPEFEMIKILSSGDITSNDLFKKGFFTIQDPTAAIPAKLLSPLPETKILDLCAAPGTKTTQLAEITIDRADIYAADIDKNRLPLIEQNISRLDIKSVKIMTYEDIIEMAEEGPAFDFILLDVPCSNTGVLAKRPEVRHRITEKALEDLATKQKEILNLASKFLNPEGRLCYSTCSIQPEENSLLIEDFLKQNLGFQLKNEKLTLPACEPHPIDGGYAAVLKKAE